MQILTSYYCSATQIYYKGDEISHLSPLVIEIPILDNFGILGFWGYLARILLHCKCAESLVVTASHCLEGHRILIWLLDSWTSDARIKKAVVHIYLKGVFTNLTSPNLISADPKQTNKQGSRRYQTLPRCTTHSQYSAVFNLSKIWLLWLSCSIAAYRNTHDAPSCENMTSSTKPEVHNISQRRHAEADRATVTGNTYKNWRSSFVWFSSYVSGQTDRQTNKHTYSSQYFAPRVTNKQMDERTRLSALPGQLTLSLINDLALFKFYSFDLSWPPHCQYLKKYLNIILLPFGRLSHFHFHPTVPAGSC